MARFKTYARKCDITGEGMNEGFCICNGEMYIKYENDLIAHLREIEPLDQYLPDEQLKHIYHNDNYYYWTEWYDESDHQYAVVGDKLIEIEYI